MALSNLHRSLSFSAISSHFFRSLGNKPLHNAEICLDASGTYIIEFSQIKQMHRIRKKISINGNDQILPHKDKKAHMELFTFFERTFTPSFSSLYICIEKKRYAVFAFFGAWGAFLSFEAVCFLHGVDLPSFSSPICFDEGLRSAVVSMWTATLAVLLSNEGLLLRSMCRKKRERE